MTLGSASLVPSCRTGDADGLQQTCGDSSGEHLARGLKPANQRIPDRKAQQHVSERKPDAGEGPASKQQQHETGKRDDERRLLQRVEQTDAPRRQHARFPQAITGQAEQVVGAVRQAAQVVRSRPDHVDGDREDGEPVRIHFARHPRARQDRRKRRRSTTANASGGKSKRCVSGCHLVSRPVQSFALSLTSTGNARIER